MSDANKVIAKRFFEELYTGEKRELIEQIVAPDYFAHGPGSESLVTESAAARADGRQAVRESLASKPKDIKVTVEDQIAEGDQVVSRLTFDSGGRSWAGVAIQRFADDKIVETWRLTNR